MDHTLLWNVFSSSNDTTFLDYRTEGMEVIIQGRVTIFIVQGKLKASIYNTGLHVYKIKHFQCQVLVFNFCT